VTTTLSVLIVDDDPALLQALPQALRLRMGGVTVETAHSAAAALERIAAADYDAIVTDIKMPGMDGLALLAEIRTRRPDTPTLIITGHGENELVVHALRGGACDFIQKPIDRDYFVGALYRAIRAHVLNRKVKARQLALEGCADQLERILQKLEREPRTRPHEGAHPSLSDSRVADQLARFQLALADRYTIERELGRGVMATVYLAQDLKHHRPVAIKVLKREIACALGPERFLREIEIAARLNHPHILTLHDSGDADGFLYFVMPYVEGESLRQRLVREKQLSLEDALQITGEVASALSYAHSHDVVHRDIKPENILLSGGEAVVADFGIARALTAAGGDNLTTIGLAVGTPTYMSPEQAAGVAQLDGRSDIYSLGCVLYEMLAGRPPFLGATAQEVMARHTLDPVPPLHPARATVSGAVEQAIVKSLAKQPAERFAAAVQFADALGAARVPRSAVRRRSWRWFGLLALGAALAIAA